MKKIMYPLTICIMYVSIVSISVYAERKNKPEEIIEYTTQQNVQSISERKLPKKEALFFNSYNQLENDMAYFNPDTARLEKWDLKKVEKFIGSSFTPSYVPKDLKTCKDTYNGSFILEHKDNKPYWTVAYNKKKLVYNNFGMFYSDSFKDEYDPLRRSLLVEVCPDNIPVSDILYCFDTTKTSEINNNKVMLGLYKQPYYKNKKKPAGYINNYVAEFQIDNVGYRITSKNLTQKEFIKALKSMPVLNEKN